MKQWTVVDSQNTILEDFEIDWLPDQAFDYLTPRIKHLRSGKPVIEIGAGSFVGSFPLNNGDTFRIVPQIGEASFWRMVLFSEGLDKEIKQEFESLTKSGYTSEGEVNWDVLLAKSYVNQLRNIEKKSLQQGRYAKKEKLGYTRGKVRILPTILSVHRRERSPVHCIVSERTIDLPEHRVLGLAAHRLLVLGICSAEDERTLLNWIRFKRPTSTDLQRVIVGLKMQSYAGARPYYIPALVQAQLLLTGGGISFSDDVETAVWLTNIRTVYEKYLYRIFERLLYDTGYVVEKRQDDALSLFQNGTYKLIPDILVRKQLVNVLVADAKYKIDKPLDEADIYQMIVYLQAYKVDAGVLIMPSLSRNETLMHRTILGKVIYEMRVPLDDWQATEIAIAELVKKLVK